MTTLPAFLKTNPKAVLVEVAETRGSTPRDTGTMMLVSAATLWGTIGGGQLEFMAIDRARALLVSGDDSARLDVPLGPAIGQCCGGRVALRLETLTAGRVAALMAREAEARARFPQVLVFGAGHVGLALVRALAPLPMRIHLIDPRPLTETDLPDTIRFDQCALPEALVATLDPGGAAIILTHDHALDFLIARAALARDDLAYVGMIGSATKRATLARHLAEEMGEAAAAVALTRLTMPIGQSLRLDGRAAPRDKRPAVIAALVVAELLLVLRSDPSETA